MQSGEIFFEHERWGRNLAWSAGLHIGFTLGIIVYALIAHGSSGSNWGRVAVAAPWESPW
jgi:hypothetical protein